MLKLYFKKSYNFSFETKKANFFNVEIIFKKSLSFFQKHNHIPEHIGCNFTKEGNLAVMLETTEERVSELQKLW